MYIRELFKEREVVFSFEIFPPRPTSSIATIYDTIEKLEVLNPDYISVTYGAGGSMSDNRTCQLSSLVKNRYNIEALAHLTCIGSTRVETAEILRDLQANGIDNILALRGDISDENSGAGEFKNSQELIRYIRQTGKFGIAAACYPEGHIENNSIDRDVEVLKLKQDAGADYFISQLFFDNNHFYNFLDKAEKKGVNLPIQAGIMPVINKRQIQRIVSLCGATLPSKFIKIMNRYEHNREALRDAGIAYAVDQIVDLISTGVRGIHLYTMNNPYIAENITRSIDSILSSINERQII